MIGAYCVGGYSTLHLDGTTGASCEGGANTAGVANNVVVVCAKR